MKHIITRRQQGVGLIEVLVGLFILAFGLIALAVFSNRLFTDSAESKARLEAMQLAQQKLEDIRDVANAGNLDNLIALVENNVQLQGQNTVFTRSATEDSTAAPVVVWTVTVGWVDSRGVNQNISLETEVQLVNLAALASLGEGSLGGGGNIDLPIGVAKYGEDGETVEYSDADKSNGVAIVVDENTKTKYVVLADGSENDGQVLVKIENYSSSSTANDFAIINGSVYFNTDVVTFSDHSFSAVTNLLLVRPSDVGICPWHMDGSGEVLFSDTDNASVKRLDYTCYVGSGWYGSLVVVNPDRSLDLTDPTRSNNRTCGGDPYAYQVPDDGGLTTHTPQLLSARREYRGYKVGYNTDQSTPLVDADGNRIYLPVGIVGGDHYGKSNDIIKKRDYLDGYGSTAQRHDFYLQEISLTGSATSADEEAECDTEMKAVYSEDNVFTGNSGNFVCLYGDARQRDIICPYVKPSTGETVTANPVTMRGNIRVEEDVAHLVEIASNLNLETSQNEICELSISGVVDSWIEWTCTIYIPNVDGEQSGTWTGNVILSANNNLNICGTSTFNVISATSSGIDYSDRAQFTVSEAGCGSTGFYNIAGVIENANNKEYNLAESGAYIVINSGTGDEYCNPIADIISAKSSIEFSCYVPLEFSGTISLITGIDKLNSTVLNFGGNPVDSNLSGQVITLK